MISLSNTPQIKELIRKIFSNSKSIGFEKVIRLLGNFILAIFIANTLGPQKYGNYIFILSFIYMFFPIIDFGTTEFIIKDLTNKKYPTGSILGSTILLKLKTSLSMAFVSFISYLLFFNETTSSNIIIYILIFSLSFLFRSLDSLTYLQQSELKNHQVSAINNLVFLISLTFKIIGIKYKLSVEYFISIASAENFLYGCFYFLLLHKKSKVKLRFSLQEYNPSSYIKEGLPLFYSTLLTMFHSKIDLIFIQIFLSSTELGKYALANRFVQAMIFIPETINIISFPILISKEPTKKNLSLYFKICSLMSLLSVGLLFLIAISPITKLLNNDFQESFEILKYLSPVIFFMFFNFLSSRALFLVGKTKLLLMKNILILFFNIFLNIFLTPLYGINGVIIATILSYTISIIIVSIQSNEYRNISFSYFLPFLSSRHKSK